MENTESRGKDETPQEKPQINPLKNANTFQSESRLNDKLIRLVVSFLGVIVLIICVGTIVFIGIGKINKEFDVPDILIATASTAIGAIAGLLTPSTNQNTGAL